MSAFDELKAHFYERRVQKRYWCLVSRIPSLEAGIIDVPLAEGFINGIYKVRTLALACKMGALSLN